MFLFHFFIPPSPTPLFSKFFSLTASSKTPAAAKQCCQQALHQQHKKTPEDTTLEANEQGDVRLHKLRRICRSEINNTMQIIRLIESIPEPLLQHAARDEFESVMILGTREKVLKDLYKKIEIMENHRRDLLRLYKDYNK